MGVTIVTHNGVSGRHPLIEILSARHRHQLMSILGAWHTRVRSFGSDSRCALVTARVRAAGREFRRSFLAPAMIPQSPDVHRENGLGRLARIGCSRPAALLNLMPIFFRFRVLESEPPTSSRIGCMARNFFANVRTKRELILVLCFWSALLGIFALPEPKRAHRMLGAPYF